jgi:hypothetical protein
MDFTGKKGWNIGGKRTARNSRSAWGKAPLDAKRGSFEFRNFFLRRRFLRFTGPAGANTGLARLATHKTTGRTGGIAGTTGKHARWCRRLGQGLGEHRGGFTHLRLGH